MRPASELEKAWQSLKPRILVCDIETRPNLVYTFGLHDQNIGINQIVEPHGVMCWAAKWYGEPKVLFRSTHHDGYDTMVRDIWELVDEADIIVGYNHRSFDMKHLAREWALAGLPPPSPWQDIDLLSVVRRRFRFPSNKLDWVSRELGIGHKVPHAGFELWRDCMAGDDKAWAKMRRYNKHDVVLTELAYSRLLPWINGHPNMSVLSGERVSGCTTCGATELEDAGWQVTQTRAYQRFRCVVCRSLIRSTVSDSRRTQHRRTV